MARLRGERLSRGMRFFSGFRRRAVAGWLAVEIDADRVRLAHVVANGGQPVLEFAEERQWDPSDPKSLERVAREFGVKRFRCTTLLKPREYNILLVEAPAVKPDELKAAVRWRIKDMLDYHVDDATIDVLDVPVPPGAAQRPRPGGGRGAGAGAPARTPAPAGRAARPGPGHAAAARGRGVDRCRAGE